MIPFPAQQVPSEIRLVPLVKRSAGNAHQASSAKPDRATLLLARPVITVLKVQMYRLRANLQPSAVLFLLSLRFALQATTAPLTELTSTLNVRMVLIAVKDKLRRLHAPLVLLVPVRLSTGMSQ